MAPLSSLRFNLRVLSSESFPNSEGTMPCRPTLTNLTLTTLCGLSPRVMPCQSLNGTSSLQLSAPSPVKASLSSSKVKQSSTKPGLAAGLSTVVPLAQGLGMGVGEGVAVGIGEGV